MISHLLKAINLENVNNFGIVETAAIEAACSELDVEQLKTILTHYTNVEEMFTHKYLHGRNENIKLLVDMGKSVEQSGEAADEMYTALATRETLYFRCLVEAFRAWHKKTRQPLSKPQAPTEVTVEPEALSEVRVVD